MKWWRFKFLQSEAVNSDPYLSSVLSASNWMTVQPCSTLCNCISNHRNHRFRQHSESELENVKKMSLFKKQMGIKMGSCSILFGFATFLALGVSLVSERCMSLSMSLMWMVRSWLQLGSIQLNVSLLPGIDRSSFRVGSLASCHCATGSRNKILV